MRRKLAALLLLTLCAVPALTGCGRIHPVGEWTAAAPYADHPDRLGSLAQTLERTDAQLTLRLELEASGRFLICTDQASLDRLIADLRGPIAEAARKSMLEKYQITEAQLEDRLEALDLTMDQLTDQFCAEWKDTVRPAQITGTWRVDGEELILSPQAGEEYAYKVRLSDDVLTIESAVGADGLGFGDLLPLAFQMHSRSG